MDRRSHLALLEAMPLRPLAERALEAVGELSKEAQNIYNSILYYMLFYMVYICYILLISNITYLQSYMKDGCDMGSRIGQERSRRGQKQSCVELWKAPQPSLRGPTRGAAARGQALFTTERQFERYMVILDVSRLLLLLLLLYYYYYYLFIYIYSCYMLLCFGSSLFFLL